MAAALLPGKAFAFNYDSAFCTGQGLDSQCLVYGYDEGKEVWAWGFPSDGLWWELPGPYLSAPKQERSLAIPGGYIANCKGEENCIHVHCGKDAAWNLYRYDPKTNWPIEINLDVGQANFLKPDRHGEWRSLIIAREVKRDGGSSFPDPRWLGLWEYAPVQWLDASPQRAYRRNFYARLAPLSNPNGGDLMIKPKDPSAWIEVRKAIKKVINGTDYFGFSLRKYAPDKKSYNDYYATFDVKSGAVTLTSRNGQSSAQFRKLDGALVKGLQELAQRRNQRWPVRYGPCDGF
ncbi:MAG: hypothetical protein HY552_01410 [Elusimicrobia bacterium]|nr:hypothetical protein [Elusimicrobiota bacterium]